MSLHFDSGTSASALNSHSSGCMSCVIGLNFIIPSDFLKR